MPTYPAATETLTASAPIASSLVPVIAVPTHGSGGSMTVLAKALISAPPAAVLAAIRDTQTWPKWNSFCPSCTIDPKSAAQPASTVPGLETNKPGWLQVGSIATIEVYMNGDGLSGGKKKRDQGIEVTVLEEVGGEKKGYRIAWKSTGMSHWQMHSERVMEIVEVPGPDGKIVTEYVCWETFGGALGSVVKATVGKQLVERFGDYARDVKAFAEGKNDA